MCILTEGKDIVLKLGKKTKNKLLDKRNDGTRQSLIEAGLELFGEYGFKATSTRMLSHSSGANISAIPYYFGDKESLYKTVVEHIVQRTTSYIGPSYEEIRENLAKGTPTKSYARTAIKKLVESAARMFVDSDEPKGWVLIIMREQARPTEAFGIFYSGVMKNLHSLMSTLIAICVGLDPKSDEVKIRTHALLGQVLVFLSSREVILRQLGVKKLKDRHVNLIHKVLWAHVEAALNIPKLNGRKK